MNLAADASAKLHLEWQETPALSKRIDWDSEVVSQQRRCEPRPPSMSGPLAHDGMPAMIAEIRSALEEGGIEDDAVNAVAEMFRQPSPERDDAISIPDDVGEESGEGELDADEAAIELLNPNVPWDCRTSHFRRRQIQVWEV